MKTREVRSAVREGGILQLSVDEVELPDPGDDEVVIRVEGAPLNPSDLGQLFGAADVDTARVAGTGAARTVLIDIPASRRSFMANRVGTSVPVGNEGAGVVVAAGAGEEAQALLGRTVATFSGGMLTQLRVVRAADCLVLPDGVTPAQGASCFVNPLTVLGMVGTMRLDGHTALVHTAAASNLGQMLVKVCLAEDVPLVNVVRRPEQAALLRGLGATHVCDSSAGDFKDSLLEALVATDATVAFDALGGGTLASDILTAMERAQARKPGAVARYGTQTHKQLYVYGGLDPSPMVLSRNYGMAWGVAGWLLTFFLDRVGPDEAQRLRERVASEITTTFASSYAGTLSLDEVLSLDAMAAYGRRATGQKYLVDPSRG